MDIKIAQKRVNDLATAMVAKGMREPTAYASVKSSEEPIVGLNWKSGVDNGRLFGSDKYHYVRGASLSDNLDKAATFIAEQPNAEQAKLQDFMAALGSVIDIGRKHNIEVEFLNPLVATMKTLSSNILTHGGRDAA